MSESDNKVTGKISLKDIDFHARKSFPPCMANLHTNVKKHAHLKHWGRLQYGMFLKGIGLSVEENIQFFKKEFTRKIDADKFDKAYSYNIRHFYGKEGKRADYQPWSCTKVMKNAPPGVGEYHGCPFKTFKEDNLNDFLISNYGLSKD